MNGKVGRQVEAEITLRVESWCRGGKGNIGDEGHLLLFLYRRGGPITLPNIRCSFIVAIGIGIVQNLSQDHRMALSIPERPNI